MVDKSLDSVELEACDELFSGGCWWHWTMVLLELCMRQAVEFPTNVWIIDRDFNPHEERGQLAYVLAQKYREATGNEVGTRVFKPCVPDENSNYLYKLIDDLGGENGRVLIQLFPHLNVTPRWTRVSMDFLAWV